MKSNGDGRMKRLKLNGAIRFVGRDEMTPRRRDDSTSAMRAYAASDSILTEFSEAVSTA
mgnify:CR=1 FL=1